MKGITKNVLPTYTDAMTGDSTQITEYRDTDGELVKTETYIISGDLHAVFSKVGDGPTSLIGMN